MFLFADLILETFTSSCYGNNNATAVSPDAKLDSDPNDEPEPGSAAHVGNPKKSLGNWIN